MNKFRIFWHLYRYFGAAWLAYRLAYALRIRTGLLKRHIPAIPWDDQPLQGFLNDVGQPHEATPTADPQGYLAWRRSNAPHFFFTPTDRSIFQPILQAWDQVNDNPCQEADQLVEGIYRYFAHTPVNVGTGVVSDLRPAHTTPDWHRNPFTGQSTPADRHWSQIDDFKHGDIKLIWDLSRFGFVYPLVRAYWHTCQLGQSQDHRYAELFWQLIESWRGGNPPQLGANWKCGQETSLRVMAWCFGLYGFLDSPATTPERVAGLAQMIAVSAKRIEANLPHALSQRNNHGVSEGMGLWTIGLLFPEFRSATRWLEKGRAVLESLARNLIYEDGTFSQHSANYQRLALHNYLWAIRLGELNHQPLSAELIERVKRAGQFLYQVQDEESGRLPCFGHNDGSLVLRLNSCDYTDYRPVIQAISYLTTQERLYPPGPWDEDLLWLFGPASLQAPSRSLPRTDFQARHGGYFTLRSNTSLAFVHCAAYRHRPAHADELNLDIWWRGQNVVLDPGTYTYNAPPPWDHHPLARSMVHNVVTVDGLDPMDRLGPFLWLPWVKGSSRVYLRSPKGKLAYWEGEQDGYQRLPHPVRVRRGILQLGDDAWLVLDRLDSDWDHTYRLQWLLPDHPYAWDGQTGYLRIDLSPGQYQVSILASVPGGVGLRSTHIPAPTPVYTLVRADDQSPRGWRSAYYNEREPALSVDCTARTKSILFCTLFGPVPCRVEIDEKIGRVDLINGKAQFELEYDPAPCLVKKTMWSGETEDFLDGANGL